jgi:hypothetical protein
VECATADFCRGCRRHVCEKHDSVARLRAHRDAADHWTVRALFCTATVPSFAPLVKGVSDEADMVRPCDEPLGFVRFLPLDGRPVGCAELRCGQGHVLHVELPGERST